jgi:hypothetical protein
VRRHGRCPRYDRAGWLCQQLTLPDIREKRRLLAQVRREEAELAAKEERRAAAAGGGARVRKRGIERQFQRLGHFVTNDHPDYDAAAAAGRRTM